MARHVQLTSQRTYATETNAHKAANEAYPGEDQRYIICRTEAGRYYPVFIGPKAVDAQVFFKFPVVA